MSRPVRRTLSVHEVKEFVCPDCQATMQHKQNDAGLTEHWCDCEYMEGYKYVVAQPTIIMSIVDTEGIHRGV